MFYFIFINYSLPPNQALPSRKQRDAKNAQADSRRPDNVIARSAIQINTANCMAVGGFKFLLLTFQYLVGWGIFNLVISMNLFRFQHIENYQRRSLFIPCFLRERRSVRPPKSIMCI
jgi:hypothetical protein